MTTTVDSTPVNYYRLLGIPYSASSQEITRAYRNAMKAVHPDRASSANRVAAEEEAKLLNQAWRTLTRPADRLKYDQSLRSEVAQEQIMSRYFGGMGMPGSRDDRFGDVLQREERAFAANERKRSDRGAVTSVMLIFAGATALVVCSIIAWAAVSALVHALL